MAASVTTALVVVPPTIEAAFSASADSVIDPGVTGEWHAPAKSAAEARDTKAVRSFMVLFLLIAMRAS